MKQTTDRVFVKVPLAKRTEAVQLMASAVRTLFKCGGNDSLCVSLDKSMLSQPK